MPRNHHRRAYSRPFLFSAARPPQNRPPQLRTSSSHRHRRQYQPSRLSGARPPKPRCQRARKQPTPRLFPSPPPGRHHRSDVRSRRLHLKPRPSSEQPQPSRRRGLMGQRPHTSRLSLTGHRRRALPRRSVPRLRPPTPPNRPRTSAGRRSRLHRSPPPRTLPGRRHLQRQHRRIHHQQPGRRHPRPILRMTAKRPWQPRPRSPRTSCAARSRRLPRLRALTLMLRRPHHRQSANRSRVATSPVYRPAQSRRPHRRPPHRPHSSAPPKPPWPALLRGRPALLPLRPRPETPRRPRQTLLSLPPLPRCRDSTPRRTLPNLDP